MPEEPLGPLAKIEELFKTEIEKLGGRTVHFSISPSKREVTVLIDLNDDLFLTEQEREDRDVLADIEQQFAEERVVEKAKEAKQDLSEVKRLLDEDFET